MNTVSLYYYMQRIRINILYMVSILFAKKWFVTCSVISIVLKEICTL